MNVWVSLNDRMLSVELRERMGIESLSDIVKWNRLRVLEHALQKDDNDWVKKSMLYEVEGMREREREVDQIQHGVTWWRGT